MSGSETASAASCSHCGHPLTGPYCANCGTRAPDGLAHEGWTSVASQLLDKEASRGHAATLMAFLRAPVQTILARTLDPTYRSHWTFLSLCLGVQLTLSFVILPRLFGGIYHVPGLADKSAILTNQLVQYAGIVILTPIQYYLCRALGSIARTPASYVKLCVLSVSYCAIISTVLALTFWGLGVASTLLANPFDPGVSGLVLTSLAQVAIVVFVTLTHRRFWGMSMLVAAVVTLGIALLSWGVVYPALMESVTTSGLGRMLDDLLP